MTTTTSPTVSSWYAIPGTDGSVTYGVDADGAAWERATARDGSFSFFPLGTPAPTWAPANGRIDVLAQD